MNKSEVAFGSMIKPHQFVSLSHEADKMIVYEKGDLLYVYNFHSTKSHEGYKIGTPWASDHFIVYESDEERFGGHQRINDAHNIWHKAHNEKLGDRNYHLKLYVPNRSVIVLCAK